MMMLYRGRYVHSSEAPCTFNISQQHISLNSLMTSVKIEMRQGILHKYTPFLLMIPNLLFVLLLRVAIWRERLDPARISATSVNLVMSFTLLVMFIELALGMLEDASDWFLLTAASTFISFAYFSHYAFTKCKILN